MRDPVASSISEAESYWARTAPELSDSERACIAHAFGTARNLSFTPSVWQLCQQVNLAREWDGETCGFQAMPFDLIVFMGGKE